MSRELTEDEVQLRFLDHVRALADYWNTVETDSNRVEGVAMSILSLLDGEYLNLPGFVVSPCPDPEDKAFHMANGEDWFPAPPDADCDIGGGCLHERFHGKGIWAERDEAAQGEGQRQK